MSSGNKAVCRHAGVALLFALVGTAMLSASAAEAQYIPLPWSHPYYDGYPPPTPPGRIAAGEMAPPSLRPDEAYAVVPLAEIRRRIAALGFHLIAVPRRKDRIYLAEAEDVHGLMHRLVFDAYQGNMIENTKLTVLPKRPKPVAGGIPEEAKSAASKPAAPLQ